MTDNTEPTIEQKISDIIASDLVLATDNGQPYIQYDDTAVDKITNLISDQVAKARIELLSEIEKELPELALITNDDGGIDLARKSAANAVLDQVKSIITTKREEV